MSDISVILVAGLFLGTEVQVPRGGTEFVLAVPEGSSAAAMQIGAPAHEMVAVLPGLLGPTPTGTDDLADAKPFRGVLELHAGEADDNPTVEQTIPSVDIPIAHTCFDKDVRPCGRWTAQVRLSGNWRVYSYPYLGGEFAIARTRSNRQFLGLDDNGHGLVRVVNLPHIWILEATGKITAKVNGGVVEWPVTTPAQMSDTLMAAFGASAATGHQSLRSASRLDRSVSRFGVLLTTYSSETGQAYQASTIEDWHWGLFSRLSATDDMVIPSPISAPKGPDIWNEPGQMWKCPPLHVRSAPLPSIGTARPHH